MTEMKENQFMSQENLLNRYNCGPVKFAGSDNALYERHLTFDHVLPVPAATLRRIGADPANDVLRNEVGRCSPSRRHRALRRGPARRRTVEPGPR